MPRNYGPPTNLVISEEAAKQLEFLLMIERARGDLELIEANDLMESLIAVQYNKVRAAFNKAMESLKEE